MSKASTSLPETAKNIIVIRQHDQLGDMLCAVPLLRALRLRYPESFITLVASPVNYEIMLHHPFVNNVLNYNKKAFYSNLFALWDLYRSLRSRRYDLAIVPATVSLSATSNLLAFLSGATIRRGPERLEHLTNSTSWCFTSKIALDWSATPRRHQALRNLDILQPFGVATEDLSCVLGLTDEERREGFEFVKNLRKDHNLLVGIHPGAGKLPNRWPAERFASVANRLSKEHSVGIVITAGSMDDTPLASLTKLLKCQYALVHKKPIRTVAAIIDQLDLVLTNDTGIMHIAGATGPNVLALFGPTDPLQWAPIGTKNRFIAAEDKSINSITEDQVYNMLDVILHEIRRDLKLR